MELFHADLQTSIMVVVDTSASGHRSGRGRQGLSLIILPMRHRGQALAGVGCWSAAKKKNGKEKR